MSLTNRAMMRKGIEPYSSRFHMLWARPQSKTNLIVPDHLWRVSAYLLLAGRQLSRLQSSSATTNR